MKKINQISFKNLREKLNYFYLFVGIETLVLALFFICNFFEHGDSVNYLMLSSGGQFNDYFMHVGYASSAFGTNIYEYSTNACFPPLAYIMYAILARVVGYVAVDPTDIPSHKYVGNNLTVFLIYSIICIVLLLYVTNLYLKGKGIVYQVVFPCIIILSYPVAFSSLQRGNSVFLVAILISIALKWRNDTSKIKREMAMVLIAICAGFKIYPALFGLLYIKEKRLKETLRLTIYGLFLFFVPFVFFGGLEGIESFFHTVFTLYGEVHDSSIYGVTNRITQRLFGVSAPLLSGIVQQSFLILSIVSFFLCKKKWSELLFLCGIMTVYISSSWMYTCVYFLPVLFLFLSDTFSEKVYKQSTWDEWLIFILLLIVFSVPFDFGYYFIYDSIVIIVLFYSIYIIFAYVKNRCLKSGFNKG